MEERDRICKITTEGQENKQVLKHVGMKAAAQLSNMSRSCFTSLTGRNGRVTKGNVLKGHGWGSHSEAAETQGPTQRPI